MRAILIVAFIGLATPSLGEYTRGGEVRRPCEDLPPVHAQAEPNVPYKIVNLPSEEVQISCGGPFERVATACARWVDPASAADGWVIFIDDDLPEEDYGCVLTYEKAHLPPNNWVDKAWEAHVKHGASDPRPARQISRQ